MTTFTKKLSDGQLLIDAWQENENNEILLCKWEAYDDLTPADLERCEVLLSYTGMDPAEIIETMEMVEEVGYGN